MNIVAIIPERMGSSRFPGKPLSKIKGIPMVAHIFERVRLSAQIDGLYVASPDQEIISYVKSIGGKTGLEEGVSKNAPTTIVRALNEIEKDFGKNIDWVIMVQGDEPMIDPMTIDELAKFVRQNPHLSVVNVVDDLRTEAEYHDPNIVKIVLSQSKEGIWFFRKPSERWNDSLLDLPIKKQTGIIAFRKDFLLAFGGDEKTPIEKVESVDMFRLIEKGESIPVIQSKVPLYSVDTEEDILTVERAMESDGLITQYAPNYEGKN